MGFKKWRCFLWAHCNISLDSARQQCNIPRIEPLSFKGSQSVLCELQKNDKLFWCFQQPKTKDEYTELLNQLYNRFGDIHPVEMTRGGLEAMLQEPDWIHGCLARLFVHSRLYQCSRFIGNRREPVCPGRCELSQPPASKLTRKPAAKGGRRRFKRSISSPQWGVITKLVPRFWEDQVTHGVPWPAILPTQFIKSMTGIQPVMCLTMNRPVLFQ